MIRIAALLLSAIVLFSLSCQDDEGFNIFTVEDDVMLGQQLRDEVLANPDQFPILDENQYPDAYAYVRAIRDDILASGEVKYADEFAWEVRIVEDDSTLNAFAAPGGYIFVYTGLIKFLDEKDDFVGVMGHEMAHADRRHSTQQLTQNYGVSVLLGVLLGENQGLVSDILGTLLSLQFSRGDETEADTYSVIYLCETEYAANGAASFFEKLINAGTATPPEFLSTHPNPDNRVENINMQATDRGCDTAFDSDLMEWSDFQNSLP